MKKERYYFYGIDNEIRSVEVDPLGGWIVEIRKHHCKCCGCRIAVYSGDPHYLSECPNCHNHTSSLNDAIKEEEDCISELIYKLNKANQRLDVFKRKNTVYQSNMEDLAMINKRKETK